MGKDKGSLVINGKPMITHILDAVCDIADEIIIVLRDSKQILEYNKIIKHSSKIKIVIDKLKDQGPLMGIITGLSNINSDTAQILPCDSPYISKEFVLKMFTLIDDFDAVVPIHIDGHIEPLHSIYNKKVINNIEILISNDKKEVNSLIKSINVKYIQIKELDPTFRSFKNINRITDFKK